MSSLSAITCGPAERWVSPNPVVYERGITYQEAGSPQPQDRRSAWLERNAKHPSHKGFGSEVVI